MKELRVKNLKNGSGRFEGKLKLTETLEDYLSIGVLFVRVKTETGNLRTPLYPEKNKAPEATKITSHNSKNSYGIRDIEALYELNWSEARDTDGDFVSYTYQLSETADFENIIYQGKTGRETGLKMTEKEWFKLLGNTKIGEPVKFYHRILASDGANISYSKPQELTFLKSDEPLNDFAEIPAPNYVFKGKLETSGAGYGAEWDAEGKLWLADYNRGFIIKNENGEDADFSPLTSVEIDGKNYNLRPVTGMGVDKDGNILAGINGKLIKIDAETGKGLAIWEVPEGKRAITDPRAAENGEIYAMSLFGEDPNYILRQDGSKFTLVKTLKLENRNLSRAFDMTKDAKKLFFPDPGSPQIQVYTRENGMDYVKQEYISSIAAGSSAVKVIGNSIYAAVRSSGISPSSFHYRNEEKQQMWTLELPEVNGAEPRGIGVSPDEKTLILCSLDKGGGYYLFQLKASSPPKGE